MSGFRGYRKGKSMSRKQISRTPENFPRMKHRAAGRLYGPGAAFGKRRPQIIQAHQVIPEAAVEAAAAKAFQKHEGVKWAETYEHTRNLWRERYRKQMEAMARAEAKKTAK